MNGALEACFRPSQIIALSMEYRANPGVQHNQSTLESTDTLDITPNMELISVEAQTPHPNFVLQCPSTSPHPQV